MAVASGGANGGGGTGGALGSGGRTSGGTGGTAASGGSGGGMVGGQSGSLGDATGGSAVRTGGAGAGGVGGARVGGNAGLAGSAGLNGGRGGVPGGGGNLGAAGSTVVAPSGGTCGVVWKNGCKLVAHDPSVLKDGDTYYAFRTNHNLAFYRSTDKLTWSSLGNAMPTLPTWTGALGLAGAPDIWAPDVHQAGGKFYLYYSVSFWGDVTHSAIGLMTNTTLDPAAPGYRWVDQGKAVGSPEGGSGVNVIDPNLFVDDDGTWWLAYGSFQSGIRLVQLDPATGLSLASPPKPAVLTTSLGEGVSLIKANGYYYLFVSRGGCCNALASTYEIVYGRSTKVTGPYVNRAGAGINGAYERLLPPGSDGNPGQGGQSFFKENGQWYMAYHAYTPPNGDALLNVRPIYFDDAGWVTLDICKAKGYRP